MLPHGLLRDYTGYGLDGAQGCQAQLSGREPTAPALWALWALWAGLQASPPPCQSPGLRRSAQTPQTPRCCSAPTAPGTSRGLTKGSVTVTAAQWPSGAALRPF